VRDLQVAPGFSLRLKFMPYDAGGNCHPDSRTAITASVRFVTFNTLRMAVM
jgi:hypothetical protein